MPHNPTISRKQRTQLARDLVIGAPVAALLWLLLLRLILGTWNPVFPLIIIGFSLLVAAMALCPDPIGTIAFRFWKTLVFVIDWSITRLCCAFLYFFIFTPLGWLLKLLRVPLLDNKPDPQCPSLWIKISPKTDTKHHFFRQF